MADDRQMVEWDGLRFDVSMVSPAVQRRMRKRRYESQSIDRVKRFCPTDLPFINFGGGMGIVDCLQNVRMQDPEKHLSVEGNPENCEISAANRQRNGCKYSILNKAVAYSPSVEFFVPDQSTELMMAGSVDSRFEDQGMKGRKVKIETTSLEELVSSAGWDGIALVVDIEGAELSLVEEELDTIAECCDWLLIEWHYTNDEGDADRERAFVCKRHLKQRMNFITEHSGSRMSMFERKHPKSRGISLIGMARNWARSGFRQSVQK